MRGGPLSCFARAMESLPSFPNHLYGDPRIPYSLALHLGLRDLPKPTGPENEAIFVRVSAYDPRAGPQPDAPGLELGCTELRHLNGPNLDFSLTIGLCRAVPTGRTGDARRVLLEVFTTHADNLPTRGGSPFRYNYSSDRSMRPAGVHTIPMHAADGGGLGEDSDGLLDESPDSPSVLQPLRASLTDGEALSEPGKEPRALGWVTAVAVPLSPLAQALGIVRLRVAFKNFPMRSTSDGSKKPSSPYMQLRRVVGQERDVLTTMASWCSAPKRSGGKRDDDNPPPEGTPAHVSEPVEVTIPVVALLDRKAIAIARSLNDVRFANMDQVVRLQINDWAPDGDERPFGYLDVKVNEILDPTLPQEANAAFLDASLTPFGGQPGSSACALRILSIELLPMPNPITAAQSPLIVSASSSLGPPSQPAQSPPHATAGAGALQPPPPFTSSRLPEPPQQGAPPFSPSASATHLSNASSQAFEMEARRAAAQAAYDAVMAGMGKREGAAGDAASAYVQAAQPTAAATAEGFGGGGRAGAPWASPAAEPPREGGTTGSSGAGGGALGPTRSSRLDIPRSPGEAPPPHVTLAAHVHPSLASFAPPSLQSLQPGGAASSQSLERISALLRMSHGAGAAGMEPRGGGEGTPSSSAPFAHHTPTTLGLSPGGAAAAGIPAPAYPWVPTGDPSVARIVGYSRPAHVEFSTPLPTPPSAKASFARELSLHSAQQEAKSSALLGISLGRGAPGAIGRAEDSSSSDGAAGGRTFSSGKTTATIVSGVGATLPLLPPPAALGKGRSAPAAAAAAAAALHQAAAPPLSPWAASLSRPPALSSSSDARGDPLPTSSTFRVAGRAALEACTRHNIELFNALLKNAGALGVGSGEWVTAYAQQLESGSLGIAHPPPRDLLASAAVSLNLTRVLESLEFVHTSMLAMDIKVVEDAQAGAEMQVEAERRVAAQRDPQAWWRASTEVAGGRLLGAGLRASQQQAKSSLSLPSLAETTIDDIPLAEFGTLKEAATRSLTELVSRWPSRVLEEVGCPGQLREFLITAAGPLAGVKSSSESAYATLLREHDAHHAEHLLVKSKLAQAKVALESMEQESAALRAELKKSRETLAVTVDRMRTQLAEHATKVAEFEGVTWTGAGDVTGLAVAAAAAAGGSGSPARATTPSGGLSRLVTTSELIALACVPNDETTARQRRMEAAKARGAAVATEAPVATYRELIASQREEYDRLVRGIREAGEARVAKEASSGDTVYEAGVRDAGEAGASASAAERTRLALGGGRGAEALTTPSTDRMGLRQRLETKCADVERCREEQRRLNQALSLLDSDLTALHVRYHCTQELANLKGWCRAVVRLNKEAVAPMSWQSFLLAALGFAPYSSLLYSHLLARHPPLASRYTMGPALASPPMQLHMENQQRLAKALGVSNAHLV